MNSGAGIDWSLVAFIGAVIFVVAFMLIVPPLLGGKSWARAKHEPFESGIVGVGGARLRLSAKFYLVAIFFVLFDIEALFLYTWAVSVKEVGWLGFVEVFVFVTVLLVGLIYIIRLGALNWSPNDRGVLSHKQSKGGVVMQPINLADITNFLPFDELAKDKLGKIPAQLSGEMTNPMLKNEQL